MSTRYDQSGKVFSHVISKEPVRVILQTRTARIEGEIYRKHDERILDAINDGLPFIAVTNAVIYESRQGEEAARKAEFVVVNREAIEWLTPEE